MIRIMLQQSLTRIAATPLACVLDGVVRARQVRITASALLALSLAPTYVSAADLITDGSTVRIRSMAIEAGWHTGRVKRDERRCSMIQLDRPTEHGYTMIALMVVEALQLGHIGQWTAISPKQAIASEPAHCLIEGTD
jgi:hypothetical protein